MPPPFTEMQLRQAVAESLCWRDVLRNLGRRDVGHNRRTVQKYVRQWEISIEHFDPMARIRRGAATRTAPLDAVLVANSSYERGALKKRLYRSGLLERRCCLCGQGEEWMGRRMSLILDHINGISNDHRLENLRIVCPNCAATLETHCNRNSVRSDPRACLICEAAFVPSYSQHRYCSLRCVGIAKSRAVAGVPRPERRKVERPPYEQLMRELAESSFVAVGRKYGVSDNAVRKWVRAYERALEIDTD